LYIKMKIITTTTAGYAAKAHIQKKAFFFTYLDRI